MARSRPRAGLSAPDLPDPRRAPNVRYNPTPSELRALAADGRVTEFDSPAFISDQRSRCADRTRNAVDAEFDATDRAHIETAADVARGRPMLCLDRRVGRHPAVSRVCRLYVPAEYARIALAWANLFEPAPPGRKPSYVTIQIPDHDEIAIRVLPDAGFSAVLGSDYTGEAKKSILRLFMYDAKREGGLGLHAGSKLVTLSSGDTIGQLFLGLSATGKSTLTCHDYGLDNGGSVSMRQDDVCALLPGGTVAGSEGRGLYIKTAGLAPTHQPALYDAATHPSSVLENVDVDKSGTVDFGSDRYTANGRAVVLRDRLRLAADEIDLPRVDQIFFITRNPVMPIVTKLTTDQAAAAFMLGESIETSAGDPDRAGEAVRVVGTNPFIMGPPGVEGNRFRNLVADLDVSCYVLNTGEIGDDGRDVRVADTVQLLRSLARGDVSWRHDPVSDLVVPETVPGLDMDTFALDRHVSDLSARLADVRADRRAYLDEFSQLDPAIAEAVY